MNNTSDPGPLSAPTSAAPRVLIVEDDACTALAYKNLLQREGYTLVHCADGQAALDALARETFDAVVLDLMMPRIDGIQVLKAIRAAPVNPLVSVIIITAARLKVVEDEAKRFGAKMYLDKTQTDELLAGLRQIMAERTEARVPVLRMAPVAPIAERSQKTPQASSNAAPVPDETPAPKRSRFFSF